MPRFAVILPAAGRSSRLRIQRRKKPFLDLKGRAVWVRAAELFTGREDVAQMLLVVAKEDREWFEEKFRPNLAFMDIEIVEGGAERADSVAQALARVRADIDFVAVHDAARPLLVKKWIDRVFQAAVDSGAAILAIPITATLKRVADDRTVMETVPREGLWEAQTPQVFRRDWLLEAYAQRGETAATDDAQLVERLGHPVTVVEGSPMNLKITTADDFEMAKVLLDALPKEKPLRALHPFADEEPRIL